MMMRLLILLAATWGAFAAEFEKINAEAERLYGEKSFAKAHELYVAMEVGNLSAEEKRWVEFRRADTLWRGMDGDGEEDAVGEGAAEKAEQALRGLVDGRERKEDQDRVWAEAEESLGQLLLRRRDEFRPMPYRGRRPIYGGERHEGWEHIEKALEWWAGSKEVELARKRYIELTWWIFNDHARYEAGMLGYALENVTKIATDNETKAHAHLALAQVISQRGNVYEFERANAEFEAAVASGKGTQWYDDALAEYAQWLTYSGRVKWDENGNPSQQANPKKALELLRRLVAEFNERDSPHVRQARSVITQIEAPQLGVSVSSLFMPNTTAEFNVSIKNVKQVEFTLRRVDLHRDFQQPDERRRTGNWGEMIKPGAGEVVKRWTKDFSAKEEYVQHYETERTAEKLTTGAYLLEATGGGQSARELILVTDIVVVATAGADRTILFVCDAQSGAPVAKAPVKFLESFYDGRAMASRTRDAMTDENGLAEFAPVDKARPVNQALALVSFDGKPAMTTVYPGHFQQQPEGMWKLYVVTDRPAYRPNEKMQWKVTARRQQKDLYTTPSGEKLKFHIQDARGQKVKEGEVTLNSFGSAWGELDLTAEMTLGQYQIVFAHGPQSHIGAGQFRIEEYKLPEFKVTVQTPEQNGRAKIFRLGEKVEVTMKGEYYFGGPVANAAVHVVVKTNTLYHIYRPARAYPWLFEDHSYPRWRGNGEVALEKDLTTDAEGKATLTLETAAFGMQDVEFTIEARMTDSSRREIIGSGNIRVTRFGYQVHARAKHSIHRPNDKAEIEFRAVDANDQGVVAEGKIKVTRDFWREKSYEHEDVMTGTVKTDAEGKAEFSFTPTKDGYYRIAWVSEDKRPDGSNGPPIKAEATIWVASNNTTELGYRHGDLEIVVDKDTFQAGQKAAVMLHTPANDRWVLLTVVTDRILRREVIRMAATVKMIEVDVGEEHVPNFWIKAVMVSGGNASEDTKEIVVPPVKNFLEVTVAPDKPEYRARDEGKYIVTTKDHAGKATAAEVEFGVIDEAIFYIQGEYAGDPRQFFFGQRRYQSAMSSSTFSYRGYREEEMDGQKSPKNVTTIPRNAFKSKSVLTRGSADRFDVAAAPVMMALADTAGGVAEMRAPGEAAAEPVVRSDFRSTIFWQPDVKTDADGTARVTIKYPDSVTTWKATARAASTGNQFGVGSASTHTTQPIIVRLQAPRFFVVGDEVTISAVINNNTTNSVSVVPEIFIEGLKLTSAPKLEAVTVAGSAEARVDWKVVAEKSGEAKIRVTGKASAGSDSMERTFPVHEHGIEKFISQSGKMNSSEAIVKIDLPARRKDSTRVVVQVTPSLAVTMLDALPYLLDYPYGCTEQTMSRFLPAAIIAKTLTEVGLDAETAMARAFGGIEAATAAKTQPKGKRNLEKLNEIVQQGLERLRDMQHGDGGWGWWKEGASDPWMTAYVVWGLSLARDAKLDIDPQLIETGSKYLTDHLAEAEKDIDLQAWMLHACAASGPDKTGPEEKAVENLWTKRAELKSYSRALFAWAAHVYGDADKAKVLIGNLENGVRRDENSGTSVLLKGGANLPTAHWGASDGWWRWADGPVETTAFALRALLAIDPQNKLTDPTANWLIKNRRGAQWSNTRDTAITLLALSDYLKKSGELNAEGEYAVSVNGTEITSKKFTAKEALSAPSRFQIDAKLLRDGGNEIRIVRKAGQAAIYFAAEATFFSLEEPVAPAANEIFARRQYFRLAPKATLLKGNDYERVPLKEGDAINSGDRLEVAILIESKNNYEYLVFEDLKPGGFEAVQIRSGEGAYARQVKPASATRSQLTEDDYTAGTRWIYQEMRDRKVATFVDQLPQGFWELRYELRAEAPGKFHALPTLGHAMYVPEIRCNTAETLVIVRDSPKK
jgi:alpha-2-macroglobulin